ncbi:hypothetical protein PITC_019840 [Penicillium italicum]|uniref:Uncharacterized protein n=1 Tax=Penicillium italicum TaxID=40296 RepID=A0A0A2L2T3_PENIT|nr:hypothetical protein PITC_019840 [Penicillium italicum]
MPFKLDGVLHSGHCFDEFFSLHLPLGCGNPMGASISTS